MATKTTGLQKYQKSSQKKASTPATSKSAKKPVDTDAVKVEIETRPPVSDAVEQLHKTATENSAEITAESDLAQELQQEIQKEAPVTQRLVNSDISPVNTQRDRLIQAYAPLIKYIAQKIASRLPANIELDDLISSGVIGLMDAIDKYDSSRDNKFKTYAEFRIRGSILDELRAQDWVPRSVREKAKTLERCYQKIEQSMGRSATDDEVCQHLNISKDEYHDLLNEVRSVSLLSFEDFANLSNADKRALHGHGERGGKTSTPFNEVSTAYLKKLVAETIDELPEKQRLVLSLYYYEDLNLKEIGRVLEVTESRVSQLHSQAIVRLKAKLKNHWGDFVSMVSG